MRAPSVLLVEPEAAMPLETAFRDAGVTVFRVLDAEAGWRSFVQTPPDVVFVGLTTPRRDAAWLLRRMQEDYLGSLPPVYLIVSAPEIHAGVPRLDIDGAVLRPVGGAGLPALLGQRAGEADAPAQASRLRDLFDLTLLSGDLAAALKLVCDRTARAFRSHDCVLVLASGERRLYAHRTPETTDQREALAARCELAAAVGTSLIYSGQTDCPSYLAVPIEAPGGGVLGTIALVSDTARRFLPDERQALRGLARRAGAELAYRSAHDRLASEHDRLRRAAVLDPLLGVMTLASLEEASAPELARERGCVAVLDVVGLRHVNDRWGHLAGDAVLLQLSERVRASLRPGDLLGRVEGDELAVVLPGADAQSGHDLCEGILHAVAATPFAVQEEAVDLRIRIGAVIVDPDTPAAAALERARQCLRQARAAGASLHILHGVPPPMRHTSTLDLVPASQVLAPGTTLGGMYRILHEIAQGAMGVVYRAEDMGLSRPVAVKVLRPELARDAALVERFRGEAAMLASVRHENLVAVYTLGTQADLVYFVMELVEGESLQQLLHRVDDAGEAVPLELVERVVLQVAGALEILHKAGAVHRDVKPANILLDRARDRVVLVDVGVARGEEGDEASGTPGFGAPETFLRGNEGPGTDVYGLAATTYMLLTGLAPFGGGIASRVVKRQLVETPASPSSLRGDVPAAVDRVLQRALAADLPGRHVSALEFARELSRALREPAGAPRPRGLARGTGDFTEGVGATRGAVFRVAYRILGNRLGTAWVRETCERAPDLKEILRPTVGNLQWYPVEKLGALLQAVPASVRDPKKVARELGRAAMTAVFARFYGTDPATATPAKVLGEVGRFWSRLHSWGLVTVEQHGEGARVAIERTPKDPLICCLVEGTLERIAELAGAAGA
ncbi:MAG TPA: protein kinase, partial [Haliangiales bacterium]|nr:protein kinase [Haliangiales bacterium]